MPPIIHDLPATGNHPLGLHCIISLAERWTSCWIVPLGGPSLRDGLRSFDKASAHCLGNGFDARLDAKLLVDMTKMRLDCGRGNRTTHTGHLHELSTALRRICRAGCGKAAPALPHPVRIATLPTATRLTSLDGYAQCAARDGDIMPNFRSRKRRDIRVPNR